MFPQHSVLALLQFSVFTVGAVKFQDEESNELVNNEKSNKLLRRGFKNWEERCLTFGGQKVLEDYLSEQEHLIFCMLQQFDIEELELEIEKNKKSGDLDLVFKKYCSDHVPAARECLADFLAVSSLCLPQQKRSGLNVTLAMVDSAIEYACHRDGDRIALFVSEEGVECVVENKEKLLRCVQRSVPEMFSSYHRRRNPNKMHFYVFQQENCRKVDAIIKCVEESLVDCSDPTPSELLSGLLTTMRNATPCTASGSETFILSRLVPCLCLIVWLTQTLHS